MRGIKRIFGIVIAAGLTVAAGLCAFAAAGEQKIYTEKPYGELVFVIDEGAFAVNAVTAEDMADILLAYVGDMDSANKYIGKFDNLHVTVRLFDKNGELTRKAITFDYNDTDMKTARIEELKSLLNGLAIDDYVNYATDYVGLLDIKGKVGEKLLQDAERNGNNADWRCEMVLLTRRVSKASVNDKDTVTKAQDFAAELYKHGARLRVVLLDGDEDASFFNDITSRANADNALSQSPSVLRYVNVEDAVKWIDKIFSYSLLLEINPDDVQNPGKNYDNSEVKITFGANGLSLYGTLMKFSSNEIVLDPDAYKRFTASVFARKDGDSAYHTSEMETLGVGNRYGLRFVLADEGFYDVYAQIKADGTTVQSDHQRVYYSPVAALRPFLSDGKSAKTSDGSVAAFAPLATQEPANVRAKKDTRFDVFLQRVEQNGGVDYSIPTPNPDSPQYDCVLEVSDASGVKDVVTMEWNGDRYTADYKFPKRGSYIVSTSLMVSFSGRKDGLVIETAEPISLAVKGARVSDAFVDKFSNGDISDKVVLILIAVAVVAALVGLLFGVLFGLAKLFNRNRMNGSITVSVGGGIEYNPVSLSRRSSLRLPALLNEGFDKIDESYKTDANKSAHDALKIYTQNMSIRGNGKGNIKITWGNDAKAVSESGLTVNVNEEEAIDFKGIKGEAVSVLSPGDNAKVVGFGSGTIDITYQKEEKKRKEAGK